jgi:hypothetical protein
MNVVIIDAREEKELNNVLIYDGDGEPYSLVQADLSLFWQYAGRD